MPGTVNDCMRRFGDGGAIDDREAEQYYDRFASTHPEDRACDTDTMSQGTTEYLGQWPDEHCEEAAHTAFAHAPPTQRHGWLSTILGAWQGRGVDLSGLQNQLGLPSLNPNHMGPDAYARVANDARRQHPDVMEEQVRTQPWFVKAMGNPIVMGALGVIASKLLRRCARGARRLGTPYRRSSLGLWRREGTPTHAPVLHTWAVQDRSACGND